MKTRSSKLVRLLSVLCLAVWAVVPRAPAQGLGLAFSGGHAILTVTGTAGTVYSIQYTSNLSPTNHWAKALVQVPGASVSWTDPATPPASQRFYRVAPVPRPADTNLVFIQPGTFTMGSPTNEALRNADETQHSVAISSGFWMGKHLVRQGDYLAVVGSNPSQFTAANGYSDDLTLPVERVSWSNASNYGVLRTMQERAVGQIPTNYVYRLPTESEWEYAARAGTTTAFYLGSGYISGLANFNGTDDYESSAGEIANPSGIYLQMTTPVGSYAPNPWGLYDMIGNVWEWCQDWYDIYPAGPVTDPFGAVTGSLRVFRGGSWNDGARNCRSAQRYYDDPTRTSGLNGFRVVLAPGQP